ncbi:penicillin-binding protein [Spirochaeta africana]|nr:penicillin-binding protein [Spirochaeta africana]
MHKLTTRRLHILFGATLVIALVIALQFFQLMVIEHTPTAGSSGPAQRVERGPILDRHGNILALQTRLDTVTAWAPGIRTPAQTARTLAEILDLDEELLLQRFQHEPGFLFVKRTITPTQSRQIRELQESGQLEGIHLQEDFGRSYPEGPLAAHVLGYVGIDNQGLDGIEYRFDSQLSAPSGSQQGDAFGNQIILTIDSRIQAFTDQLARDVREEREADAVLLLVMDAYTGEILAYTASPGYDPNQFAGFTSEQRRNLPISYLYEPGSVFKIFSMAAFLHLGVVDQNEFFDAGSAYERRSNGETLFRISDLGSYGRLRPADIIRLSSNVGAAYASDRVSNEQLYHMMRQFGFGEHTGIDLNGEQRGILRPPESWSARTKPTISIGQEVAVSAMQLLTAGTVFANDGVLLKPQIVRRIVSPEGKTLQSFEREPVRQVLSPGAANSMLEMMVGATRDSGTAWRARVDGIDIAAKTGTAQMLDPTTGGYSDTAFIPSTLAIFPAHAPRIIAYTALINPQGGEHLGGRIAAPIIRELAEFLVPYLGIPRADEQIYREAAGVRIEQQHLPDLTDTVPDFRGLARRTLMPLYENPDIEVVIRGSGWVARQTPAPGTPLSTDTRIILELE